MSPFDSRNAPSETPSPSAACEPSSLEQPVTTQSFATRRSTASSRDTLSARPPDCGLLAGRWRARSTPCTEGCASGRKSRLSPGLGQTNRGPIPGQTPLCALDRRRDDAPQSIRHPRAHAARPAHPPRPPSRPDPGPVGGIRQRLQSHRHGRRLLRPHPGLSEGPPILATTTTHRRCARVPAHRDDRACPLGYPARRRRDRTAHLL